MAFYRSEAGGRALHHVPPLFHPITNISPPNLSNVRTETIFVRPTVPSRSELLSLWLSESQSKIPLPVKYPRQIMICEQLRPYVQYMLYFEGKKVIMNWTSRHWRNNGDTYDGAESDGGPHLCHWRQWRHCRHLSPMDHHCRHWIAIVTIDTIVANRFNGDPGRNIAT